MILPRTPGSIIKFLPVNSPMALIKSVISTFGKSKDSIVSGKFSAVMSSVEAFERRSLVCLFKMSAPVPPVGLPPLKPPAEGPLPEAAGELVSPKSGGGGGGGKSSNCA
ncbi:hypothetical protein D3C87_1804670 [compost metagenome]